MRIWTLIPLSFLIVATMVIAHHMGNDEASHRQLQSLSVTVEEGQVEVIGKDDKDPKKLLAGEQAKLTSTEIVRITRDSQSSSTVKTSSAMATPPQIAFVNPEPKPGTVTLYITDAMGDPIESGMIEIQGVEYPFSQGVANIPDLDDGKHNILVHAEGYSSAPLEIQVPMQTPSSVSLEYLMTIDCQVYSARSTMQNRIPDQGGTEVLLWKGTSAIRPIRTSASMTVNNLSFGEVHTTIGIQNETIRVLRSDHIDPDDEKETYLAPQAEDQIIGFGDCVLPVDLPPRQEPLTKIAVQNVFNSPRLRIWDSIQAYHDEKLITMRNPSYLEYVHNEKRQAGFAITLDPQSKGDLIAKAMTDSSGKCRFEKLPPGVYFVQARRGHFRSNIMPVLPAQGGMNLTLTNNSTLFVTVKQDEVKPKGLSYLPHATVTLRSMNNKRAVFIDTTDRMGFAGFQKVPYGEYQLTVEPQNASLPTKTIPMNIEGGKNLITVHYDPAQNYRIAGRVLRSDNKQPIPNVLLNLYRAGVKGEHNEYGHTGDVGKTFTDAEGRFEFNPLTPSDYYLTPLLHRQTYTGFVQPNLQLFPQGKSESQTVSIIHRDVQNLEIALVPGVPTTLQGKVVMPDGTPASGVHFTVTNTKESDQTYTEPTDNYDILDGNNTTDEQGNFSITIVPAPEPNRRSVTIHASMNQPITQTSIGAHGMGMGGYGGMGMGGYGRMGMGMMSEVNSRSQRRAALGTKEVTFTPGDTITDLLIPLQDASSSHTLQGKVTTNDGKYPNGLSIYITQGYEQKQVILNQDGTYRVDWLKPGPLNLQASVGSYIQSSGDRIIRKGQDYVAVIRELNIPVEPKVLNFDIELKRATHLKGKIISKTNQPVSKLRVIVKGEDSSGFDETGENGDFWVVGVQPGIRHDIEIKQSLYDSHAQKWEEETLTKMEGFVPPQENILIQIP